MKKSLLKFLFLLLIFAALGNPQLFSQVLISNTAGSPDESAMLEIKSTTGGVLIPRMDSTQRKAITAKPGLLVFDSDLGSFFLYGKTAEGTPGWIDLSSDAGIWTRTNNNVYLSNTAYNVGIGTTKPNKKLVIKAENATDTLFEIQDSLGNPLMVVTPSLTKFNIIKGNEGTKGGTARGFAVGRYSLAKTVIDSNLFVVTPDSTRVYTGTAGGFAVGRYSLAKGSRAKFFYTGFDSTRVYTDGSGVKGTAGGFAVGRYSLAKAGKTKYFITNADSTTINVEDSMAGFNVVNVGSGSKERIMNMNTENSFLGHQSGINIKPAGDNGKFNSFMGYQAGRLTTTGRKNIAFGHEAAYNNNGSFNVFIGNESGKVNTGDFNIFMGHQAGFKNNTGGTNMFLGYNAGYENLDGSSNVFVGYGCAHDNTSGSFNTFLGNYVGYYHQTGNYNVILGQEAGNRKTSGDNNVIIGYQAGNWNQTGSDNVFIGNQAGRIETGSDKLYIDNSDTSTPLIWGDFSLNYVTINDVLKLAPRTSAPIISPPTEGMMYYNSTTHKLMVYDGTTWQACW